MVILIPWSYRKDVADIVTDPKYGTPSPGWYVAARAFQKINDVADSWPGGPRS